LRRPLGRRNTLPLIDEAVEFGGVLAGDLVRDLGREAGELLLDVFRGRSGGEPDASRAREGTLAAVPGARHIPEPMAGSPLKRARKQGVRLDDGSIIAFPYMPRVADLPPGWRHFSPADKIKHQASARHATRSGA